MTSIMQMITDCGEGLNLTYRQAWDSQGESGTINIFLKKARLYKTFKIIYKHPLSYKTL